MVSAAGICALVQSAVGTAVLGACPRAADFAAVTLTDS